MRVSNCWLINWRTGTFHQRAWNNDSSLQLSQSWRCRLEVSHSNWGASWFKWLSGFERSLNLKRGRGLMRLGKHRLHYPCSGQTLHSLKAFFFSLFSTSVSLYMFYSTRSLSVKKTIHWSTIHTFLVKDCQLKNRIYKGHVLSHIFNDFNAHLNLRCFKYYLNIESISDIDKSD